MIRSVLILAFVAACLAYTYDHEEKECMKLLNQYRQSRGLNSLAYNSKLGKTGEHYAKEMGRLNFFSHTGQDGSSPSVRATREGYSSYSSDYCACDRSCQNCDWNKKCGGTYHCCDSSGAAVGENIAAGTNRDTGAEVIQAWKDSPGHNANMLKDGWDEAACERHYTSSSTYKWYWVQLFGSQKTCNNRRDLGELLEENEEKKVQVEEDTSAESESIEIEIKHIAGKFHQGYITSASNNLVEDFEIVLIFPAAEESPLINLWGLGSGNEECEQRGDQTWSCNFGRPEWLLRSLQFNDLHVFGFQATDTPTAFAQNVLEKVDDETEVA